MNPLHLDQQTSDIVDVNRLDRWHIYQRLQELDIACSCNTQEPLRVAINGATTAIQLWSILQQTRGSRQDLVTWLERCWELDDHLDHN